MEFQIESLLSSRLFLQPQLVGDQVYFVSNLSGRLSLYRMNYGGSVPEPLLPQNISLPNPELIGGYAFRVVERIDKILVMIDKDGDEVYRPCLIPLEGGFPEPVYGEYFSHHRVHFNLYDEEGGVAYFSSEDLDQPITEAHFADLDTREIKPIASSEWGSTPLAYSAEHRKVIIADGYTVGDMVLWLVGEGKKQLLYGTPLEDRTDGQTIAPNGIGSAAFTPSGDAILLTSSVFDDHYSVALLTLDVPQSLVPISIKGLRHSGSGEMVSISPLKNDRYLLTYNIDGCSFVYEAAYIASKKQLKVLACLAGESPIDNGVLEHIDYNPHMDIFSLAFSSAVSPTQLYSIERKKRDFIVMHTNERLLGLDEKYLSKGEDASYESFDGTRISARLYLPASQLAFKGARPLVYYIHGGPQSQERPDFAWFSMPLIQFLTLNGFAVFVPNVRGSTGYGLAYTKEVDQDWGGKDRLDHVFAMEQVLAKDNRVDTHRAGVMGRSYGGYMTLMQAGMHPNLWKAACDMFGPYDLLTFMERIPETWKPYFRVALGDPRTEDGVKFLTERSPKTYLHQLACPMLVIQGRNDPRVVAGESEDLVKSLVANGKDVKIHIFEDEGHDVLKYPNRVSVYNLITQFFKNNL